MHPSSKQELTQQIRATEGGFRWWRRNIFALLPTRAEWLKIFTLNWKDWLTVAEWLVFDVKDLICTIDKTKTYTAWELLSSGLLSSRRNSCLLRDRSLQSHTCNTFGPHSSGLAGSACTSLSPPPTLLVGTATDSVVLKLAVEVHASKCSVISQSVQKLYDHTTYVFRIVLGVIF
jgi:hypothetical protein